MSRRYGCIMFVSDDFIADSAIPYKEALVNSVKRQAVRAGERPLHFGAKVEELIESPGLGDWEHRVPKGCRAFEVLIWVEDQPSDQAI